MAESTVSDRNLDDLLTAVESLQASGRRSMPFTIGAAVLAIGAVIAGFLYIQNTQREISRVERSLQNAEAETVRAKQELAKLSGSLRLLQQDAGLAPAAQATVDAALKQASAADDKLTKVGDATAQSAQAIEAAVTGSGSDQTSTLETRRLTSGSAKGWDVDIFWCVVADNPAASTANEQRASSDAAVLARLANAGTAIAPESTLGRIRVRPLTTNIQARTGYPKAGEGLQIRSESDTKEKASAQAIVAALGRSGTEYKPVTSRMSTPWYISLFVCESQAAGTS